MPKPSVFAQLDACAVPPHKLMPSPRCWNPGLLRYRNKLWLAYRYHRAETRDARCGVAICEIDPKTAEPLSASQRIRFAAPMGNEHHEDCRLFMFRGDPYISYTEMQGYVPGVHYTCTVKYAKLRLDGKRWSVVEEWQPVFGENTGFSKEKNWVFFEHEEKLYCVYETDPVHRVLRMKGKLVEEQFVSPGPVWHWGRIRGGTPPVELGDGRMMSIFHSSIPTEEPPHFVRYYAGAYTFERKPPFRILQISEIPVISGSEEDGHRIDPRYTQGWKPYIPFPCGLVPDGDGWLVSFGVNDWQCAVGRLTLAQLRLGATDGSSFKLRYFRVNNGTIPVRYINDQQRPVFLHWEATRARRGCSAGVGYIKAEGAREAVEISEHPGVVEVPASEYASAFRGQR